MLYRLTGIWSSTKEEGAIYVDAESTQQARGEARQRGMYVRTVRLLSEHASGNRLREDAGRSSLGGSKGQ